MLIERPEIEAVIPHKGTMCLLDKVIDWNEETIHCSSMSHTRLDNPLRKNSHIASVHAIEYGAQAMAVHGGLLAQSKSQSLKGGYLVSVRNITLECKRLSDFTSELDIRATRLMCSGGNLIYEFAVSYQKQVLASGKVTVIQNEA